MPRYHRPSTLTEALALRADAAPPLIVLAGGTDLYPARTHRAAWFEAYGRDMLDLTGVAELAGVSHDADGTRIGALTSWSEIARADLPPAFAGLRRACLQIGGVQIQNRGTLGGNLCNASPAADGAPPLLALDARVELASLRGARQLPLAEFMRGNRSTALAADELLVAIHVPAQPAGARSAFLKLGARAYLVISIASVACNAGVDEAGVVSSLAIAVGACSAAPRRLPALERRLIGRPASEVAAVEPGEAELEGLSPIDDVRASAAYRGHAARVLVRRALTEALSPALERAA